MKEVTFSKLDGAWTSDMKWKNPVSVRKPERRYSARVLSKGMPRAFLISSTRRVVEGERGSMYESSSL